MSGKLKWDQTGERYYENGVSQGALYLQKADGTYDAPEAFNGLTGVDENPDGAEEQILWADNIKYAVFRTPENHKGTIRAYTYPDGWRKCNGMVAPSDLPGMSMGGQKRHAFGFAYRTEVGNDTTSEEDDAYIIHVVYNATISPSSRTYNTKNDNPDAVEFSWDYSSTPVAVNSIPGIKQVSSIEFDSRVLSDARMTKLEELLFGKDAEGQSAAADGSLPTPDELYTQLKAVT